jgi:transposase
MTEVEKLRAENRMLEARNRRLETENAVLKKLKELERRWR